MTQRIATWHESSWCQALVHVGGQPGKAMADQIMAADKARLKSQVGTLSRADMLALEGAILVHLGMPK
jgi:mRNA interferase MazF